MLSYIALFNILKKNWHVQVFFFLSIYATDDIKMQLLKISLYYFAFASYRELLVI